MVSFVKQKHVSTAFMSYLRMNHISQWKTLKCMSMVQLDDKSEKGTMCDRH